MCSHLCVTPSDVHKELLLSSGIKVRLFGFDNQNKEIHFYLFIYF